MQGSGCSIVDKLFPWPRVRVFVPSPLAYGSSVVNEEKIMPVKRTLFEKIWDAHVIVEPSGHPPLLYIDLHLVHEVTSPQAFDGLRTAGRRVRQPLRTVATV